MARHGIDPVVASLFGGLAVIAAGFAIGAGLADHSTTAEVCAAPTSVRVADVDCSAHHPGDSWVYYRSGQAVPALGGLTAGASDQPPAGDALPGVPDDGGSAGK